mmetsp:Transcript_94976/g.188133  ORF Transcript_94976/g.188133 Transcript_94976/m.188133 type:complete len:417 (+) Transcript_94976:53-1303(+)
MAFLARPLAPHGCSEFHAVQSGGQHMPTLQLPRDVMLDGPRSLADMQQGIGVDGDTGISPLQLPSWLDMSRCLKVKKFWEDHAFSLGLAWHCSLLINFSVPRLLCPLVWTHGSDTPQRAKQRYRITGENLMKWHTGNIWDPADPGFASLQSVRKIHSGVRGKMEAQQPGTKWISMYDLACVQHEFICYVSLAPQKFGVHVDESVLEDYIFFWKCVGHQLGIDDKFNLCSLGKANADKIMKEFTTSVLLPNVANPPPHFDLIAGAYIDSVNLVTFGFPLFSVRSTLALCFWGLDLACGPLSFADTCRFYYLRFLLILAAWFPFFKRWLNGASIASMKQLCGLNGLAQCPVSGARAVQCPHSLDASEAISVSSCNSLGLALLMPLPIFLGFAWLVSLALGMLLQWSLFTLVFQLAEAN